NPRRQGMNKAVKIILGAATLWPLVHLVLFLGFILSQFFLFSHKGSRPPAAIEGWFYVLFALPLVTLLWIVALLIIYIVNVFRNDRVPQDKRARWAVTLFLGNMIAMPIYWYLYIWREPQETRMQ
ncbi:MAG: hypothetical protein L0Y78_00270, partial [candidate division NC10 bacterium]|nr:hypothetical protein [candidate division NC10 bacterium]